MTRRVLIALAASALVFACARDDEPVDPVWGKEPCAHCRMLVSERRYAAQSVSRGERRYYDDIGCLVLSMRERPAERAWVRDTVSERWVDASLARYDGGKRTPMDFGFEARSDGGSVGWAEVRELVIKREGESR